MKSEDGVEITTKTYSLKDLKNKNKTVEYQGTFIKAAKLTETGLVTLSQSSDNEEVPEKSLPKLKVMTDDELFAACGGRTAHK